jgi:hypothetical protein
MAPNFKMDVNLDWRTSNVVLEVIGWILDVGWVPKAITDIH